MVQAIDNPIAANFLTDAVVERHNFSQLNKTRIRFRIQHLSSYQVQCSSGIWEYQP